MKPNIRIGYGYDAHQLEKGAEFWLGGIKIDHTHGAVGHSDADVLSHAIADAVLGAIGESDIGYWFPPEDDSIEGISSLEILKKAGELVREKGAEIENIDSTLICEAPKVMPHVQGMKEKIATALGIENEDVGIKATTNETMGFVGREEGIAALATASIAFPDKE